MTDGSDVQQAIETVGASPWSGSAYRHTAPAREPLSGSGAAAFGGRWNPPGLAAIYLAFPVEACIAEFQRLARGQGRGAESFLPRDLHTIAVEDLAILDLRSTANRRVVGIRLDDVRSSDRGRCQMIGRAASYLGIQGIIAPSATRVGFVLAAFEPNLRRGQLRLLQTVRMQLRG